MFGFKKKKTEFEDLPESIQDELNMAEITLMEGGDPTGLFKRVSKKFPGFVPARLNLASMLLESGDISGSLSVYKKVMKDFPDDLGAIAGMATVLSSNNDYAQAEEFASRAIDSGYNWSPCYEVIAKSRASRGDSGGEAEAYLSGYRMSPHSWNYLEKFCSITDQGFTPPTEDIEHCISIEQLKSLIDTIELMASDKDSEGNSSGCNHTFRFVEKWAEQNEVNIIPLYQFLNAHGGFCDCEVCYNVSELLHDENEAET